MSIEVTKGAIQVSRDLDAIADDIRVEWATYCDKQTDLVEGRIRIGVLLAKARALLPADIEFGKWVRRQDFGTLSHGTLYSLYRIGENPARARLEAGRFSKTTGEVNTQKWAASIPMPQAAVEHELRKRVRFAKFTLTEPQIEELAAKEWPTQVAVREARNQALGFDPAAPAPTPHQDAAKAMGVRRAVRDAAKNEKAVAAFIKELGGIAHAFDKLAASTVQPVVIQKFSREGGDFAIRRLEDLQTKVSGLIANLKKETQ